MFQTTNQNRWFEHVWTTKVCVQNIVHHRPIWDIGMPFMCVSRLGSSKVTTM
jgi:hypothetical protein